MKALQRDNIKNNEIFVKYFDIHLDAKIEQECVNINFVTRHHLNNSVPVTLNIKLSHSPLSVIKSDTFLRLRDAIQAQRIASSVKQKI